MRAAALGYEPDAENALQNAMVTAMRLIAKVRIRRGDPAVAFRPDGHGLLDAVGREQ